MLEFVVRKELEYVGGFSNHPDPLKTDEIAVRPQEAVRRAEGTYVGLISFGYEGIVRIAVCRCIDA